MNNLRLLFALLVATMMVACEDEDPPMMMEPEEPFEWVETTTLEDFIADYDDGVVADEAVVFAAQVVSSNEFGNVPDAIYLADGLSSIALEIEGDDYHERYPLGTELFILATGLTYSEGPNGNVLALAGGLTMDDEETYINAQQPRTASTGRNVSDITALTDEWIGAYVRVFGLQFNEGDVGAPLADGMRLSKSDGTGVLLRLESDADLGLAETPYNSGTLRGILGRDGNDWTVRPVKPDDLSFTGTRHSLFTQQEYVQDGFTLPYQIMYPIDYDPNQSYPLVIFLHGAGERGTNNTSQMVNGPPTFANQDARQNYPAIVVFPQCPSNFMWSRREIENVNGERIFTFPVEAEPDVPLKAVIQMTRDFIADGIADADRIYVMGLSMGGIGTLEYCYYAPDIPAAAISLAGGHDQDIAFTYGEQVSIRLYAGANDGVVPARFSEEVYDAIRFLPGADIEYYEDPNRGHEWNYVLNDPTQVLPWLWQKTKN